MDELLRKSTKAEYFDTFRRSKSRRGEITLWRSPYDKPAVDCRISFVQDLVWTWNEADNEVAQMPRKAYIEWVINEWHNCKATGQALVIEKSRRLIISWLCRALELHDLGLKQGKCLVGAQTYDDAQEHVWRSWFIYDQLRYARHSWNLPEPTTYGPKEEQGLDSLILPNGSIIKAINQRGESFRGGGSTIVALEEGSKYDHIANTFGQALFVTKGKPGSGKVGGLVVIIANASTNEEWQSIKERKKQPIAEDDDLEQYPDVDFIDD